MKTLFLVMSLALATSAFAENREVKLAHESYLDGKYLEMTTHMRQALMDDPTDRLTRGNLLKLLEKAYDDRNGKSMPTDWSLPSELSHMKIEQRRLYDPNQDRTRYSLQVVSGLSEKGVLEQVQVVHYPNEVVFDKQANVGEWVEEYWDSDKTFGFWGSSPKSPKAFAEGLYLLNLKVKNKPMVQGWFILDRMDAQTAPEVEVPSYEQTFETATPTFKWKSYRSPFYKPYEKVKLRLGLYKNIAPDYPRAIETGFKSAETREFTVGDQSVCEGYDGVSKLESGNYSLSVTFQERRNFGDLILSRASATRMTLNVR